MERLSELLTVHKVIFQGKADQWGTCFISVGLVGASDEVVKRVQDAWLDHIQAIAALHESTKRKIVRRATNFSSNRNNKVHLNGVTSEMMMKIDLAVLGIPSLMSDGHASEKDPRDRVLQYLNGVYCYIENELADRIKRVRDNHRLWVVAGIES